MDEAIDDEIDDDEGLTIGLMMIDDEVDDGMMGLMVE